MVTLFLFCTFSCDNSDDLVTTYNDNYIAINNNVDPSMTLNEGSLFDEYSTVTTPLPGTQVLNLREIHDEYSQLVCDLVTQWRQNGELTEDKIDLLWRIIHEELAITLNTTEASIGQMFASIGFTSENWTTISETHNHLITPLQLEFVLDLRAGYEENNDQSDEFLLDMFERKRKLWSTRLEPTSVDNVIEIAKSSFIYWNTNFENCLRPESSEMSRAADWCAIGKLAFGDAFGAVSGAAGCGAGALLGAVGGTLGATISGAIFGYSC